MLKQKTKVVVAMSGGVDSSVAAALLLEQGYDVIGMMLKLWSEPGQENSNRCCTPDAMARAKKVSSILNIPFYVLDTKEIFRDTVVDYFLNGYAQGVTPNPCLVCNQKIRWGYLFDKAMSIGAEFFATGHYAQLEKHNNQAVRLLRAKDLTKDQSYVLGVLNQSQLKHTILPLGIYTKKKVRVLAEKFGLPVSSIKDSQDLCFLAGTDYRSFIRRHSNGDLSAGAIKNKEGKILGQHEGLPMYTIGQRKGIRISTPEPLYVIEKDLEENTLIVGNLEELGRDELSASHVNWTIGEFPKESFNAKIKIRYRSPLLPGMIYSLKENKFNVKFNNSIRDITPGQAAVIYKGEEVIASGIID